MPAASRGGSVAASCSTAARTSADRSAERGAQRRGVRRLRRARACWRLRRTVSPAWRRAMAAATATPRRRISGATSASAPARISSSPAPPRPITASADRISPRAAGSLNASFSAATPSGSPSSALAMPRGTGRRPFSTSRSQPGHVPGAAWRRASPTRGPPAMRATVSRPRPPAAKPGVGDDRAEPGRAGQEIEERRARPAEADDDARRARPRRAARTPASRRGANPRTARR